MGAGRNGSSHHERNRRPAKLREKAVEPEVKIVPGRAERDLRGQPPLEVRSVIQIFEHCQQTDGATALPKGREQTFEGVTLAPADS